jgi:hypothetical protein
MPIHLYLCRSISLIEIIGPRVRTVSVRLCGGESVYDSIDDSRSFARSQVK